jgi:hypothetical protein
MVESMEALESVQARCDINTRAAGGEPSGDRGSAGWGVQCFLTPLTASPDPLRDSPYKTFHQELLHKLCVDPPHTRPQVVARWQNKRR